jgi:hypothetical protein
MSARLCECCGQPIVQEDDIVLTAMQRRIVKLLKRRGSATGDELRDALWGDDPNGGPDSLSNLYVHIFHLNRRLKPHGLRVRGSRWIGYHIIALGGAA